MDQNSAVQIAQQNRQQYGVAPNLSVVSAERRIIELSQAPPASPSSVRDALVWVVRFVFGDFWIDLAVDNSTGAIVRREQSR